LLELQTAALGFGGDIFMQLLQLQQKNGQVQEHQQQLQSQLLNTLLIYLINVERVKK
jgi:hypothetical protein